MADIDGCLVPVSGTNPIPFTGLGGLGVSLVPGIGVQGTLVTFRMRGFDQNGAVNGIVYWDSISVDTDASDYTGSAGPVVDIVVHKVVGG